MTEHQADDLPAAPDTPVRTGDDRVDAVIDAVADLEQRPVEQHAAVFDSAHEELRRTLDEPSSPSASA